MACSSKALENFSEIAKHEVEESEIDFDEAVQNVLEILSKNYPNLSLPPDAENVVKICLRCRRFDKDRAATQVHLYFKFLFDLYEMNGDKNIFLPSSHQNYFFESLGLTVLKNRDEKGRIVVAIDCEKLPSKHYDADKSLAVTFLALDQLSKESVETQRIGIVVVFNMKGYDFGHAKQWNLARLKLLAKLLQESFPARFKGFHMVRSPYLVSVTYKLIKPFLGAETRNMINFHGNNLAEFHKVVSPDILPVSMGGKLSIEDSFDLEFTRQLAKKDEYYKELLSYGYMGKPDADM